MSDEVASFSLNWEGPITPIGNRPDFKDVENLERPGVYVCLYDYGRDNFTRIYVGMTRNFRQRMRSHLIATLGLTYWLADDEGEYAYEPAVDPLFNSADELERLHRLAIAELQRMRWYHALDDSDPYISWDIVEGVLIRHVKALEGRERDPNTGVEIRSYNDRGGALPEAPLVLENRGAEEIVGILGDSVVWPLEVAAA